MKAFIKKCKKSNKVFLSLYVVSMLAYLITYVLFTINLLHLSTIETPIRIILIFTFGVYALIWLLAGIMNIFTKKYKSFIILLVFTTLFSIIFGVASYYVGAIYSKIDAMNKDKLVYTSALVTLKNTEFDSKLYSSVKKYINDNLILNLRNSLTVKKIEQAKEMTKLIHDVKIQYFDDFAEVFMSCINKELGGYNDSTNNNLMYETKRREYLDLFNEFKRKIDFM